ncbi:protein NRT1/ PTR FAMILY 5.10-like isoform X2 [Cornus florida]|uniref:protein NRT1/ PTR FAMILY 5.10-like isoform X2 n=1 Tax=Cornus florida TaxID=4283 RepID=UPI00289BE9CF|nr:protein NRT1/ PTR FAMILY 5.10-like isoform X2 [Cornus florida]
MAVSAIAEEGEAPLLGGAVVDYKGRPASRSNSGGWKSASFIIGVEVTERFACTGISANLISYLTGPLGQSTASAAENVNAWSGTMFLLPLLGAFVADSYLGRFRTIVIASLLYILGGHKPCVQSFGADQFDSRDSKECKAKSSFFNWWYFGISVGTLAALLILSYIQDYLSWGLGFGIPCIVMAFALLIFLLGSRTYRFSIKRDEKNPFSRIAQVFINAARNWRTTPSAKAIEEEARGSPTHNGSQQFKFLNKALLAPDGSEAGVRVSSIGEVEEAKAVLRLVPIWVTSLVYGIVFAQSSTLFTKQGVTMDRSIGSNFEIPAASLQSFTTFTILLFIPIYDRIFVPIARAITGKPSGITMLQRMGTGMFISAISMVIAALVERKRLETAEEYGLVDKPEETVPMSVLWLVPQYLLFGIADVFTYVGLQEFFYDQVPNDLRSVGLALYLSVIGIGSFLSSFLISVIQKATGEDGWFSDNLNRAHLDYFYWLLAALSAVALVAFLYFAKSYIYNRGSNI